MSDINGFVHIIESPSSTDLMDGRTEGRVLSEVLRLAAIPYCYNLTVDRAVLSDALWPRLLEARETHGREPILHLSMHGNAEGVALTSGEFLSWNNLRGLLRPLVAAMQRGLLVCMSSCFGSAGCRMAMYTDNEPHFRALVGNSASATWADAAIAYASFCHPFFKGMPLETCVESMKVASGDRNFVFFTGAQTKANGVYSLNRISLRSGTSS